MKSFDTLTYQGQVRRLRCLARVALDDYNLNVTQYRLIFHGENTTFRIIASDTRDLDTDAAYVPSHFLLRIHRPGYQNQDSILSELMWLAALRDAGVIVPEPMRTQTGTLLTIAQAPGVPTPRVCSLLRWIKGRFIGTPRPHHFEALGRLMAQLHEHAAHWQPPAAFARRHWDWQGLFGDNAGFNLSPDSVWDLIPTAYRDLFWRVAEQTRQVMEQLGKNQDEFNLIHADLHLGNILFSNRQAYPIDFDDCGFAHWVYDFAVVLGEYLDRSEWPTLRDALLRGYSQLRPLPQQQLAYLRLFMAARQVSLTLWATDMAQINPRFAANLEEWYSWSGDIIARCEVEK
ncbi:MAG: phosphotransferase [Anaerolineae bacterium]|nr:phosphotransferase [Anaerolineae bacterium]